MYNPCYTCRRRHIECDRSRMPCAKCEKAGLECFQKRPVRWVKGVSIRGKMRGLSVKDASAASVAVAKSNTASAITEYTSGKRPKSLVTSDFKHSGENFHSSITGLDGSQELFYRQIIRMGLAANNIWHRYYNLSSIKLSTGSGRSVCFGLGCNVQIIPRLL